MPLEILDLRQLDPTTPEGVARLGEVLDRIEADSLLAFPTDTVWGIGTCSQDPAVVERLFEIKGREARKPLSYLIAAHGVLETIFEHGVPEALEAAAPEVWPGATTLIVDAPAELLPAARRGAPGVGLRVPDHPMLRRVLTGLPPLANTSANRSGEAPFAEAEEIAEAFGDDLDLLLLMDPPPRGLASQVLYLRPDGKREVLRS